MKPVFILAAILIFGLLIALHEAGHCIVAKLCKVKVNEFSIGMGPLIWQKQGKETWYSLRAVPFGGYCAMEGEQEESDDPRSFTCQPAWKRLLILLAGCTMNFLTGLAILLVLYSSFNVFLTDAIVGFAEGFPLEGEDGLMAGDVFYKIDGYRTYLQGDASLFLQYHRGDTIDLEIIRDGEKVVLDDFPMVRRTYPTQDGGTYTGFGLTVGVHPEEANPWVRLKYSWLGALDFVQMVRFSLVQLFTGGVSVREVSGPVGIVSTISEVGEQSATLSDAWRNIAYIAALLAVNLAVMNLLPIPGLDGGQIFLMAVNGLCLLLIRREVPEKYQMAVNAAGLAVLLAFMLLVTIQDVVKLFQ